jgi:hypothetical protein
LNRLPIGYFIGGLVLVLAYGLLDPQSFPFPKCPFLSLTGFQCPGCGSQRAIHQLLHGNLAASFRLNALFLPALIYGISGYILALVWPEKWPSIRLRWYGVNAAWSALAIILIFSIGRNLL